MGKYGSNVGKFSRGIGRDPEKIVAFLREMYPAKTAESVEADTGISAATVRKWPSSAPSYYAFVRLVCVYGPEFLYACVENPPDWLSEAGRAAARASLDAQIAALEERKREVA